MPACYVQSSPQPPPPQNPQVQPAETEHQPPQPVVVSNPPRPQPETQPPAPSDPPPPNLSVSHNPPRPQPNGSWHVYKTGSGCEAAINIQCPAGATCNPPPPQKYDCPPGIVMGKPINIITDGNGGCIIEPQATSCPPNVMCNPPRPTQVACPK
ncbi:MAG: hypothetical protein JO257_28815 [Deltaproteobacteria bacterium]|nr:hypothetical protein [Deltaproteobacteria bacterium]